MKVTSDLRLSEEDGILYLFSFHRGAAIPIPPDEIEAVVNALKSMMSCGCRGPFAKAPVDENGNCDFCKHPRRTPKPA